MRQSMKIIDKLSTDEVTRSMIVKGGLIAPILNFMN